MDFRPLELEDKEDVERILLPLGRNDSALGFANLYSLSEKYRTQICLGDEVLYVRQLKRVPSALAYFPPLGACDLAKEVGLLLEEAGAKGQDLRLVGLRSEDKRLIELGLPGRLAFEEDRDFADYFYRSDVIAAYEGPALAKKRRETRKFFRLYGACAAFEPISPQAIDELRVYQQSWFEASARRGSDEHPLELEHRKILLDLDHFDRLGLEGILLRIGGKVEGYAYGSMLAGGAFDVMVLKGNLAYRFVWRALLRELARSVAPRAELLNLEEDLGLPGLRENKMSYQPCDLMKKFQARPAALGAS